METNQKPLVILIGGKNTGKNLLFEMLFPSSETDVLSCLEIKRFIVEKKQQELFFLNAPDIDDVDKIEQLLEHIQYFYSHEGAYRNYQFKLVSVIFFINYQESGMKMIIHITKIIRQISNYYEEKSITYILNNFKPESQEKIQTEFKQYHIDYLIFEEIEIEQFQKQLLGSGNIQKPLELKKMDIDLISKHKIHLEFSEQNVEKLKSQFNSSIKVENILKTIDEFTYQDQEDKIFNDNEEMRLSNVDLVQDLIFLKVCIAEHIKKYKITQNVSNFNNCTYCSNCNLICSTSEGKIYQIKSCRYKSSEESQALNKCHICNILLNEEISCIERFIQQSIATKIMSEYYYLYQKKKQERDKEFINNSESSQLKKEALEHDLPIAKLTEPIIAIFLSSQTDAKTHLFQKLNSQQQMTGLFNNCSLLNNRFQLVDPPCFSFNGNQETIQQFTDYFSKHSIHFIFFVINYDNINEFKKNLQAMLQKLIEGVDRQKMAIIISNSEKCEAEYDKQLIKNATDRYQINSIIFFTTDQKKEWIEKEILDLLNKITVQKLNFTQTIFSVDSQIDSLSFYEKLKQQATELNKEKIGQIQSELGKQRENEKILLQQIQKLEGQLKEKQQGLNQQKQKIQQIIKMSGEKQQPRQEEFQ